MAINQEELLRLDGEYAEKIARCNDSDQECGHIEADDALCELLKLLGFAKTVEAFERLPKWYA